MKRSYGRPPVFAPAPPGGRPELLLVKARGGGKGLKQGLLTLRALTLLRRLLRHRDTGEPGQPLDRLDKIEILRAHDPADRVTMRAFLGSAMELATFPNEQILDFAGLEGRLMSSSYAPEPGNPDYEPMIALLREVFDRHQRDGHIVMPYSTLVYFSQPGQ